MLILWFHPLSAFPNSKFVQEILLNHPNAARFPENLENLKQKLKIPVDIKKKIINFTTGDYDFID